MKKRIVSAVMALILCLTLLPTAALADETGGTGASGETAQMPAYSGGSGTEADPWLISSVEDLKTLAETINSGAAAAYDTENDEVGNYHGYYFKQTADLDLSSVTNWVPIGYSFYEGYYFAGQYDGDGYTISNAKSTGKNDADGFATAGIFGWVVLGSVKNLTVKNADFRATGDGQYSYVGGIAAVAFGSSIQNCAVRNSKLDSRREPDQTNCAGGIVGYSSGAEFVNCASISNRVTSQYYGGGFVGENDDDYGVGNSTYMNCYTADCSVNATTLDSQGNSYAGGFIGRLADQDLALTNCFVYKALLSTDETSTSLVETGVFVGLFHTNGSTYTASIKTENCYYGECGITNNTGTAAEKTAAEFKDGTVANLLGNAFAQGKGYPVFATDPADYTAVDAAIAKANALTETDYTNFSAVKDAVDAVVRGKTIAAQSEVDAMAKAIEDAIEALERNMVAAVVSGETTTSYATLQDAFNAAKDGDTVKLLQNENVGDTVTVSGGAITLDLNGYSSGRTLVLESGANLTVTNTGESKNSWLASVNVKVGGSLTVDDGGYVGQVEVNKPKAKLILNEGAVVEGLKLAGSGLLVADCIPQGCYIANAGSNEVYNGDGLAAASVNTSKGVKVHPIPSEITVTAEKKTGSISLDGTISADLFPTVTTTDANAPQLTYSWYRRTNNGAQMVAWVKQNADGSYTYQEITYNKPVFTEGETFDALCVVAAEGDNGKTLWATPVTGYELSTPAKSKPSSSGGGSSSKTETIINPDGSVTKTETKSDGTVTETTTRKDGSTTKTETKPDGSSKTEVKDASGSTGTVNTDKNGSTSAEAKVSDKAVSDAKKSDEAVKIPAEVMPGEDSKSAPTVKIDLPSNSGETKIEIPVKDVTPGTVAIIVKPDGTEEIVKDSVPTKDGIQLTVSGDVTVKIVNNAKDFADTKGHWAEDSIDFVSARGLVNGTSESTFAPNAPTTRAQLWTILARQAGADLTGGSVWYEKAQAWAKANGISDGSDPNGIITRAQMVTMLWRAAGSPEVSSTSTFTDVPADSYYAKAVTWAVAHGITTGVGSGKFDPNGTCTRAQIATFLHRSYQSK